MKQVILTVLTIAIGQGSYAQGQLVLENVNTSMSPTAAANGLFWISTGGTPVLISQDFNAAFYAGRDSSSLSLLATFLLSNGTAIGDNAFGPGTFLDQTGTAYTFPNSLVSAFVQIQAWTGNVNSYAAAVSAGDPAAQSPIFLNPVSAPPGPPSTLTGNGVHRMDL